MGTVDGMSTQEVGTRTCERIFLEDEIAPSLFAEKEGAGEGNGVELANAGEVTVTDDCGMGKRGVCNGTGEEEEENNITKRLCQAPNPPPRRGRGAITFSKRQV